ncbi:MAG: ATP synthase F0 subunit C, partial [Candidatus Hydrogenedentes bacterium]|nr:ATP synthase F0 subunit C [Candidatus Hydrogenedentota bacterium]
GMMRQPLRQGNLLRTMLIGQAVGGSPSIFALVIGLLIMFVPSAEPEAAGGSLLAALLGAGLAAGLGCFGSGVGCGWPAGAACDGVARNPRQGTMITSRMVIGQAVAQSPAIFATVVALILLFLFQHPGTDWAVMGVCIGSGLAIGAGALGPGMGSGYTAGGAVTGMGRWPKAQGLTLRTMLVGQGVCETPAIFGVLVAFIMLFTSAVEADFLGFAKAVGAGISVGFGGIGPGIGSGLASGSACESTASQPRHEGLILRTMLIGQAVSQSTAIYALIIALAMLYVV